MIRKQLSELGQTLWLVNNQICIQLRTLGIRSWHVEPDSLRESSQYINCINSHTSLHSVSKDAHIILCGPMNMEYDSDHGQILHTIATTKMISNSDMTDACVSDYNPCISTLGFPLWVLHHILSVAYSSDMNP